MMKMLGNFGALVVLGLVLPASTRAQSAAGALPAPVPQRLTLDEAVQTALEKHPALRQAEAAVAKAEAQVAEVRANYFPQLSLSGIAKTGLSGATGVLGLPGFPGSPFFRNLAYSANWYQTIFDFGRTKHLVASERALVETAKLKQESERQRVVLSVKRAYFSALEAGKLLKLAQEDVEERRLTFTRAEAYYQAQMESKFEVSLAQANLAEAEGNLAHARSAEHTAWAALGAAMGVEGDTPYELIEPESRAVPPENLDDLLGAAFANRPDWKAVETKMTALEEQVGYAKSQRRPEIRGLGAGGQGRFNGTPVKQNQRHSLAAVGVIFPFFTGGKLKAQERAALAELESARASGDLLHQQIRLEVTETHDQLLGLSERIRAASQQERSAHQALRLAQARYQAQLASFLELNTAEVALTRAKTQHARTLYDFERALAELDIATGRKTRP